MFSKLSGKVLVVAIVVLLAIFLFTTFFGSGASKRTFPDQLLQLDSASIKSILISAKAEDHDPYKLEGSGSDWHVVRGDAEFEVEPERVPQVIQSFKSLKPKRMAGKSADSWAKYEVDDSLGPRVIFEMGDGTSHSVMVGKFSYDQATRAGTSFVRLGDDDETYAVDGFLTMTVNQPMNNWRNKVILKGDQNTWNQLRFTYPADSGFVLTRNPEMDWNMNDTPCDSARVVNFINTIANLQSVHFVDGVQVGAPTYSVVLSDAQTGEKVTVEAFEVGGEHQFLVRSSMNPQSYFSDAQSQLVDKLFKPGFLFHGDHEH